jgi:hypothetical protein
MTYFYDVIVKEISIQHSGMANTVAERTYPIRSSTLLGGEDVENGGKLWQYVIQKTKPQFGSFIGIVSINQRDNFENIDLATPTTGEIDVT